MKATLPKLSAVLTAVVLASGLGIAACESTPTSRSAGQFVDDATLTTKVKTEIARAGAAHPDRQYFKFRLADVERMPFADDSFHLATARMVFHHVADCARRFGLRSAAYAPRPTRQPVQEAFVGPRSVRRGETSGLAGVPRGLERSRCAQQAGDLVLSTGVLQTTRRRWASVVAGLLAACGGGAGSDGSELLVPYLSLRNGIIFATRSIPAGCPTWSTSPATSSVGTVICDAQAGSNSTSLPARISRVMVCAAATAASRDAG